MKKFNVSLLSLLAVAFVGSTILPAVAGEGCCGAKKQKAEAEDCCKDKAKAEAKADVKVAETAKATDAAKPAEAEKTAK